jgi:hypothetical protein
LASGVFSYRMAQAHAPSTTTTHSLNEHGAAEYLGFSVAALRVWRREGRGPAFIRIGRSIRYRQPDLDAHLDQHRVEPRQARQGTR